MKHLISRLLLPPLGAAALPWLLWLAIKLLHPHGGHELTSLLIMAAMMLVCRPVMLMPDNSSELLSIRMTAISSVFDFAAVGTVCLLLWYITGKLNAVGPKK